MACMCSAPLGVSGSATSAADLSAWMTLPCLSRNPKALRASFAVLACLFWTCRTLVPPVTEPLPAVNWLPHCADADIAMLLSCALALLVLLLKADIIWRVPLPGHAFVLIGACFPTLTSAFVGVGPAEWGCSTLPLCCQSAPMLMAVEQTLLLQTMLAASYLLPNIALCLAVLLLLDAAQLEPCGTIVSSCSRSRARGCRQGSKHFRGCHGSSSEHAVHPIMQGSTWSARACQLLSDISWASAIMLQG